MQTAFEKAESINTATEGESDALRVPTSSADNTVSVRYLLDFCHVACQCARGTVTTDLR